MNNTIRHHARCLIAGNNPNISLQRAFDRNVNKTLEILLTYWNTIDEAKEAENKLITEHWDDPYMLNPTDHTVE
jgi:hypothetical protein